MISYTSFIFLQQCINASPASGCVVAESAFIVASSKLHPRDTTKNTFWRNSVKTVARSQKSDFGRRLLRSTPLPLLPSQWTPRLNQTHSYIDPIIAFDRLNSFLLKIRRKVQSFFLRAPSKTPQPQLSCNIMYNVVHVSFFYCCGHDCHQTRESSSSF